MPTPITKVQGIGPFTAKALSEKGFRSLEDIAASDVASLSKVSGFGEIRASQTIASAVDFLSKGDDSKTSGQKTKKEKKADKVKDKESKDKKKEKSKDKKSKNDKVKAKKDKKSDKDKKKKKKKNK